MTVTIPSRLSSFLLSSPTPTCRPGCFGSGTSEPVVEEMETVGRPEFLGNPIVSAPCSTTPARPTCPATTTGGHGPTHRQRRGLSTKGNFGAQSHGFGTRCLRFAARLTPPHARLASGCPARLYRAGLAPQGSYERFPCCFLHRLLLPQASWRNARPLLPLRGRPLSDLRFEVAEPLLLLANDLDRPGRGSRYARK